MVDNTGIPMITKQIGRTPERRRKYPLTTKRVINQVKRLAAPRWFRPARSDS